MSVHTGTVVSQNSINQGFTIAIDQDRSKSQSLLIAFAPKPQSNNIFLFLCVCGISKWPFQTLHVIGLQRSLTKLDLSILLFLLFCVCGISKWPFQMLHVIGLHRSLTKLDLSTIQKKQTKKLNHTMKWWQTFLQTIFKVKTAWYFKSYKMVASNQR